MVKEFGTIVDITQRATIRDQGIQAYEIVINGLEGERTIPYFGDFYADHLGDTLKGRDVIFWESFDRRGWFEQTIQVIGNPLYSAKFSVKSANRLTEAYAQLSPPESQF